MKKFISKALVSAMALTMIAGVAPAEEVNASNTEYYIYAGKGVGWNITVGYDNDDWDNGDSIVICPEGGEVGKHEIASTAKSTWTTVAAGEDATLSLSDLGKDAKITYLITAWTDEKSITKEDPDGPSKDLAAEKNSETGEAAFTDEVYVLTVDGKEFTADNNFSTTVSDSYSAKLHFSSQVWNDWCAIFVKVEKGSASTDSGSSSSSSSSSTKTAGTSDNAAKTGDATGVVALSALAVLSFAGVVVLKKRNA